MKKTTASVSSRERNSFNPKDYERPGVTLEEVLEIREAFDLFDYEATGLIDSKGTPPLN
jgi:Ca2+-binding EF-hand superfamily protein